MDLQKKMGINNFQEIFRFDKQMKPSKYTEAIQRFTSSQKICKAEIVEIFVDQIHFCERFGETNMFYFNRKESLDCTGSVLIG